MKCFTSIEIILLHNITLHFLFISTFQ